MSELTVCLICEEKGEYLASEFDWLSHGFLCEKHYEKEREIAVYIELNPYTMEYESFEWVGDIIELKNKLAQANAKIEKLEAVVEACLPYRKHDLERLGSHEMAIAYPHMCDLPEEVHNALSALPDEFQDHIIQNILRLIFP